MPDEGVAIKQSVRNVAALFYPEFALQTRISIALSQRMFAKALLKAFSGIDIPCKSFYRSLYEIR